MSKRHLILLTLLLIASLLLTACGGTEAPAEEAPAEEAPAEEVEEPAEVVFSHNGMTEEELEAAGYVVIAPGEPVRMGASAALTGPIPEFAKHFPQSWNTIYGFILMGALAAIAFVIWRWEFDRRERKAELIRAAEARGELII